MWSISSSFLSGLSSIAYRGSKVLVSLDALHFGANLHGRRSRRLYAVFPLLLACTRAGSPTASACATRILLVRSASRGPRLPACTKACFTLFLCPTLIGLGQIFFHSPSTTRSGRSAIRPTAQELSTFARPVDRDLYRAVACRIHHRRTGFPATFVALASISLVVVLLALAFPRMVPPRGAHPRRKTETARVRPAQGSGFAPHPDHERCALTASSCSPSTCPYTASPSGFLPRASAWCSALRRRRVRGASVMQELARRFTEAGC